MTAKFFFPAKARFYLLASFPESEFHLDTQTCWPHIHVKAMLPGRSMNCGRRRRVCRQTGEHQIDYSQLTEFSENSVDELSSPLRMAEKLTVVRSRSGEKTYIFSASIRGQDATPNKSWPS